ncbi:MAG TPA: alpha/beta hydrolase [Polyangiaceae bacterium]|nr:alpha/beta hydrolase [Polyangiaceae bacterium]
MRSYKFCAGWRAPLVMLLTACGGATDEMDASGYTLSQDALSQDALSQEAVSRVALLESVIAGATPALGPAATVRAPALDWVDCGDGFECSTAAVPLDYSRPRGRQIQLAVTRLPARDRARRIGSLFVNFGGPGADAVSTLQDFGAELLAPLNERFDLVGFDPRGTGQTEGAFDCQIDQATLGLYAKPFATPDGPGADVLVRRARAYIDACLERDMSVLPYASTADAARDMDLLRSALGEPRLSYLGFSYGTFLGATYASLFPTRYRALVLDGAVDADQFIQRPSDFGAAQAAGFELALDRFFQACAANQAACFGFGGADPWGAYDQLVARADRQPLPTDDPEGRMVDGSDLLLAAFPALYAKESWPYLAAALALAEQGDGSIALQLVDASSGRLEDGSYDPAADRFFLISAAEDDYSDDVDDYLRAGETSWAAFPHFWTDTGYVELPMGLLPVRAKNAFYGPFRASSRAPSVLVIGTTYDPATPYRGSVRLATDLGNATLLTMQGDGHTAYGGRSLCIDAAVQAYLEEGVLPPAGTSCAQETPFEAPPPPTEAEVASGAAGETRLGVRFARLGRFRLR